MELEGAEWAVDVKAPGREKIRGFAVTGDASGTHQRKFVRAKARIVAPDTLEVWSDEVADPVAVCYGWAGFPIGNLYNVEKLPASPFTTDEWLPRVGVAGTSPVVYSVCPVKTRHETGGAG